MNTRSFDLSLATTRTAPRAHTMAQLHDTRIRSCLSRWPSVSAFKLPTGINWGDQIKANQFGYSSLSPLMLQINTIPFHLWSIHYREVEIDRCEDNYWYHDNDRMDGCDLSCPVWPANRAQKIADTSNGQTCTELNNIIYRKKMIMI